MKRLQLKNKVNKTRNVMDVSNYKKRRNYLVKLNNQCKRHHFDRLNPERDSKPFWKSCKPYLSKKHYFADATIAISENGKLLTKNNKIVKTFSSFFESMALLMALDLLSWSSLFNVSDDRVQRNILSFLNCTRILKINESFLKHLNLTKHFLTSMFLRLPEKKL